MRTLFYTALFGLLLIAAGCDTKGEPVELSKACAPEQDEKVIEVTAFLDDKGGVYCSNTGGGPVRCGFDMTKKKEGERSVSADIVMGTSANNVEQLESGYRKEDIKIRDNEGKLVDLSKEVRVTGTMHTTQDASVCYLTVAKIEQ